LCAEQSYIIFRGELIQPDFRPGPESLEVKLFSLDEIPWESLAFTSVVVVLKKVRSFADSRATLGADGENALLGILHNLGG
jgi:hypothetical protein